MRTVSTTPLTTDVCSGLPAGASAAKYAVTTALNGVGRGEFGHERLATGGTARRRRRPVRDRSARRRPKPHRPRCRARRIRTRRAANSAGSARRRAATSAAPVRRMRCRGRVARRADGKRAAAENVLHSAARASSALCGAARRSAHRGTRPQPTFPNMPSHRIVCAGERPIRANASGRARVVERRRPARATRHRTPTASARCRSAASSAAATRRRRPGIQAARARELVGAPIARRRCVAGCPANTVCSPLSSVVFSVRRTTSGSGRPHARARRVARCAARGVAARLRPTGNAGADHVDGPHRLGRLRTARSARRSSACALRLAQRCAGRPRAIAASRMQRYAPT